MASVRVTVVFDDEPLDSKARAQARRTRGAGRGMAHDAHVHALVRTLLEQDDLAASALLAGSAEQHDFAGDIVLDEHLLDRARDGDTRDSDKVVPAGVPHARERVHLGVHANCTPAGAVRESRDPGSFELVVPLYLEALLFHVGRKDVVGMAGDTA